VAKGRSRKTRVEEGIANGVSSRSFFPLIREIFHVVDDEHFMFATGAREANRPAEPSASIRMTVKVKPV
jgi:hypothetical protein